ncbi:GDP-mannose transporter into the lumen of the Golgi [Asterophora parasitica]|uniref:GDP-mannose transporter n=1 Tax=Asterophora parasitica TaxID=117018 RepID=A0A9P7G8A2_9AGAR|nr:GDP-mannose transporter into the lumen of the Golgi [Asterophora parasitica]
MGNRVVSHGNGIGDEDVAEVKKALATGALREKQPSAAKKTGIIKFRPFDTKDAKAWFPISALLVSVIYTGSKSLQFLSIPVYTIFKNLTIIVIAYGEVFWFDGRVTGLTFISFVFMVISSIIAAWSDVSNALSSAATPVNSAASLKSLTGAAHELNIGYFWMLVNCLTSAGYVLAMRKRIKVTGFSDWDSMFYNNLLCIPVLVVSSLLVEDWSAKSLAINFPQETRIFLLAAIAFSGAAAVGISYTTAWCIRVTSSTTYSMVGALNKLPVAASGMLFFGDPVTPGSVSAVSVGFFAGLVYSVAKNKQKQMDTRKEADMLIPLVSPNQSLTEKR